MVVFVCPICGEKVEHGHSSDVSSPVTVCKTLPGAIWVRVMSDDRAALDKIPVSLSVTQELSGETKGGFAGFNDLTAGPYSVTLGDIPEQYDPPNEKTKTVNAEKGVTKVVSFKLRRRAKLKVKLVVKSGANLATESPLAVDVPVKADYTGDGAPPKDGNPTSKSAVADFGAVSSGKVVLTPTFSGLSKDDYEYTDDPQEVTLNAGDDKEVPFYVVRKVKLTAKFVLKACGPNFTADEPFKPAKPITVNAAPSGAKGSKDSKATTDDQAVLKLTPGNYKVAPDYSVLDDQQWEWKDEPRTVDVAADDDPPVVFPIGRKAKLKVEIVYKYDPDKHLRDKEDGVVPVKLEFQGNDFKPAATLPDVNTQNGVADFPSLSPGKYKVTPDFTKLDRCKFDCTAESREVEVFPGVDDPVIFKVEPLYQKVQFIGHTLLTIPTQVYEAAPEDANKLDITTPPSGKRTFAFRSEVDPGIPYTKYDFLKLVCPDGATVETKAYFSTSGAGTKLMLRKKTPASLGSWTLADLHADLRDTAKIEFDLNMFATFKVKPDVMKPFMASDLKGVWKARYHGYVDDNEDITHRMALVDDTLKKALAQADKDPTVLKVFMIPECFFQGLYGAYLVDGASTLLTKLQALVAPAKWKDWVFSFGTVNSVFAPLPPKGAGYSREVYEMQNHAPVIRGGSAAFGGSHDACTRMIQKLVNSAELADDLIVDARATRRQAINAEVQFTDTQNDHEVGKLLMRILNDETANQAPGTFFTTSKGLPAEWWPNLMASLRALMSSWGLTRVTRAIRVADNTPVDSKPLGEWMWVVSDGSVNNKSMSVTEKDAVVCVIEQQWKTQYTDPLEGNWADDDPTRRVSVLDAIILDIHAPANACGFVLQHQKDAILVKIRALKANDGQAKTYVPEAMPRRKWKPVIFPIWKKLVELYNVHVSAGAPIKFEKESMNLEDYCFAGPRKVGAWFGSLSDARSRDACKVMVFGLEICADHAANRLEVINTGGSAVGIDIHLVPSAGMRPKYFAARQGGYLFNCDGWNKAPEGGKAIEVPFDGPNPYSYKNDDGYDVDVCPVFPHTGVARREDAGTAVGACLVPATHNVIDASLTKVIFESGEGELHVYALQDLPK